MRYVAAYLLAQLGGNESVDFKAIEKILSSVGIEADKAKAEKVIKELSGKSVDALIAEGSTKLSSMPSGGGAASAAPAAAAAAPAAKEEPSKYNFSSLTILKSTFEFSGCDSSSGMAEMLIKFPELNCSLKIDPRALSL